MFLFNMAHLYKIHYIYGLYGIETYFVCSNMEPMIIFTCLEVPSSIFIKNFQLLLIF